jgi:hypothetical protein
MQICIENARCHQKPVWCASGCNTAGSVKPLVRINDRGGVRACEARREKRAASIHAGAQRVVLSSRERWGQWAHSISNWMQLERWGQWAHSISNWMQLPRVPGSALIAVPCVYLHAIPDLAASGEAGPDHSNRK